LIIGALKLWTSLNS